MKTQIQDFKQNIFSYLTLFLGIELFNSLLLLPTFRFLIGKIFILAELPFDSIRNIQIIISERPLAFCGFIALLLILLLVLNVEFIFLINCIKEIHQQDFLFRKIWNFKSFNLKNFLLFLVYGLFVAFFLSIFFRTPLLVNLKIPEFVMDYMSRSWWLLLILGIYFFASLFWAIHRLEQRGVLKIVGKIIAITVGVTILFDVIIYFLQKACAIFPGKYLKILAIFNLDLIQLFNEIAAIFLLAEVINLLVNTGQRLKNTKKEYFFVIICLLAFISLTTAGNISYFNSNISGLVLISHRGVDQGNGVQNTISALNKTAKKRPDYVEIDVHETKDGNFVVMHDEDLRKLAGRNEKPHDLTLKQLTKITVSENGKKDKIASFDQYLLAAKKLHQKLLIEIKTTPKDSRLFLTRFNKKYSRVILENNYLVQSLDYHVVEQLHKINPRLKVFYIQPYNFAQPDTLPAGFAMEYSTLNARFIRVAHRHHQQVYVWTTNSKTVMKKMLYEHVDGIITDNLSQAKRVVKEYQRQYSYVKQLKNYLLIEPAQLDFLV